MDWFREGGWAMYPLVCTGGLGLLLGLAAVALAFMKKRAAGLGLGAATVGMALLGCCTMGGGYYSARNSIDRALANVDPAYRAQLEAQGLSEAMNILTFGLCTGALPMLFGLVAVVRASTLPKGDPRPGT